ncbi:MAG: hypothetical protein JW895_16895 [Thermoleophilaceae bacterium]|nr:hypothetical protein [Thermoleophilaceae bacterium]
MQTFRAINRRLRRALNALRPEGGSMLIEVMVGAMILAITTTAVLGGLDGANKTNARNKARSVAAALAEQDQERMKAMPVAQLLPYITTPYSRTVAVNGANYTVVSSAAYATDPGSVSTGCSATAKTQTNLKITSTVSSPSTRGNVDIVGLVTPPASSGFTAGQGRVIVKVVDRDQAPIQGVNVALAGASNFSEETNAAGCAIFSFLPAGNFTATISDAGPPAKVDWDGLTSHVEAVTSTAGQTTTYGPFEMERPATINAQFDTRVGTSTVTAESAYMSINNAKLAVQWPTYQTTNGGTNVSAAGLFPFLDGYGIYAGRCIQNKPATVQNTTPDPNQTITPTVRVPSINVRVVNSTSTTGSGPAGQSSYTIVVKPSDGCSTTYPTQTSASVTYGSTTYAGAIPKPGYPYGSYTVCAQRTVSGVTRRGFADKYPYATGTAVNTVNETVDNTSANGNGTGWNTSGGIIRIYVPTSGSTQNGSCPT